MLCRTEEEATVGMVAAAEPEEREILPLLETYAQYGDTIFEAYEGTWKMTIVYKDGTQKHYLGPARENAAVGDILLSEFIRRRIPIGGLYLLG